jgi:multiple sugar transport system substrate-binding protein
MPATPMVISVNCENPDNAWEFVSFYCGPDGQRLRMEGQGNAVPTIDGLEDIVLTGHPANSQAFLDAVDIAFLYPQAENTHPGLTDALIAEIDAMLAGDQDPVATVSNMQLQAEELLAE